MSAKLRDQAAEVLLDAAHVYCLDAFLRSELEGLDRTLRNLDSIEQSYAGYIRKDFLEPLIGATSGDSPRSRSWKKNRPPKGGCGQKVRISYRILVEAGGIENPDSGAPSTKK